MTPKEKAEELMQKMNVIHYFKLKGKSEDYKGIPVSMHNDQIKGCALVAVDEIVNNSLEYMGCTPEDGEIIYWENVKQEIEKL